MKSNPSTVNWEARKNIWLPLDQRLMIWRKWEGKLDFRIGIFPFLAFRQNFIKHLPENMKMLHIWF
jgi:hypothetical protein